MSLRARLVLVLGVVLLGPLAAAAFSVAVVVPGAAAQAGTSAASRDAASIAVALVTRCQSVGAAAERVANEVGAAARAHGGFDVPATVQSTARAANSSHSSVTTDRGSRRSCVWRRARSS